MSTKKIVRSPIDATHHIDSIAGVFRSALAGHSSDYLSGQAVILHAWLHQVDIRMLGLTSGQTEHLSSWVTRADALLQEIRDLEYQIEHAQWGNVTAILASLWAKKVAIDATLTLNGVV
jgi:hypothetical protein